MWVWRITKLSTVYTAPILLIIEPVQIRAKVFKFISCVMGNHGDNSAALCLEYADYCIFHVFVRGPTSMKKFLCCDIATVCVREHVTYISLVMTALWCDVVLVVRVDLL